jgi:hypothetical protein
MEARIIATPELASRYFDLFVNRLAHTLQSTRPDPDKGRHYYYRPKRNTKLTLDVIRKHLEGQLTVGLYAINPRTQRCKWVAIDADYADAVQDLLKLQWELGQDGVQAALERSRRGGHLWLFGEKPLLARDCRIYIHNLAKRLKLPVKGVGLAEGIEVFPKQSEVPANEFGNALRGPLGVHRGAGQRYWFYGADYSLDSQLNFLSRLKRITEEELSGFVAGLVMPEEIEPKPAVAARPYCPTSNSTFREFRILEHVSAKKKGRNYWAQCPACAHAGRDKGRDNLAISVSDPRKYKCWAGCSKEMIRSAVGCPIRSRVAS